MNQYQPILLAAAEKYGVDPTVAQRVMHIESRGNPNAVSPAGAIGLMQLMPKTAAGLGVDPYDPVQNIDGGVRYLKQQIDKFGPQYGPAAYNAGPGRVSAFLAGRATMPQETQNYMNMMNGGNMPVLANSMARYGVPLTDASLGEVKASKIDPQAIAALQAMNQERASVLPIALGAMISSNKGAQNFGNQLYDYGIQGMNPMRLAHGKLLPDGTYLTDDSTQALKGSGTALRNAQTQQRMDQIAQDNAPANTYTDESGVQQVDPNAPWRGLRHKESMTMRNQTMNTANKELDELRKAYGNDTATLQSLEKFGEYNRRNATGGVYDKLMPDWAHTGEHSSMIAEQNKLTPLQRPAGSGATSDFEQRMYKMGIPNIGNTGNTNAQIRLATQALIDTRAARLSHYEQYLAKFGHLNGAEASFAPTIKAIDAKYQPMIDAYGAKNKTPQVSNQPQSVLPHSRAKADPSSMSDDDRTNALLQQYK